MSDTVATKSFKVPKRKKEDSKDNLRPVELTNRDSKELITTIERSFIDSQYSSVWELKTVMFVENRELEERYRQKKTEMKEEGRRDLQDQYGFMLFNDPNIVTQVVKEGLRCRRLPFNGLGNSKLGVYVSRNADVQLKLADGWGTSSITIIVVKMTLGKCKSLASNAADENTEPTPNFDCHVFQQQPRPSDPVGIQLSRSQVYLYEYNDDCEPTQSPRQCLPYAVLNYTRSEKAANKSYKAPVDSYSKRAAPVLEKPRMNQDSEVSSKTDPPPVNSGDSWKSNRDPRDPRRANANTETRTNPLDPRVSIPPAGGLETGLCVPHLSAVPMPALSPADPRLGPASKQVVPGLPYPGYRPKFGPENESNERLKQLDHVQQQLFSLQQTLGPGLPPLNMPDRPIDPRLARQSDQRPRDPRLKETQSGPTHPAQEEGNIGPDRGSFNTLSADDKSRKKITLTDYKRKPALPKLESNLPVVDLTADNLEPFDPSIQHLPPNIYMPRITNCDDEAYNPEEYYPHSPTKSPPINEEDDFVEKPEDMAKTLNELSDPDDESQSASSVEDKSEMMGLQEHIENADDPALADAMRKLVEHSGNIELFTEALQCLQESAEEFGESLTNPEFLVKIIAEKIEGIAKTRDTTEDSESENQVKTEVKEEMKEDVNSDIKSPDAIQSPDASKSESVSGEVPHIPLESKVEKKDILSESMKKTLEELEVIEKSQNVSSSKTDNDLLSIPLPPNSPTKKLKSSIKTQKDNVIVEKMELKSDQKDHSVAASNSQTSDMSNFKSSNPLNSSTNVFSGDSLEDKDERLTSSKPIQFQIKKEKKLINLNPLSELGFGSEDVDLRKIGNTQQAVPTLKETPITQTKETTQPEDVDVDLRKSFKIENSDVDLRVAMPISCGSDLTVTNSKTPTISANCDHDLRIKNSKVHAILNTDMKSVESSKSSPKSAKASVSETALHKKSSEKNVPKISKSVPYLPVSTSNPALMDRDDRTRSRSNSPLVVSSVFMDIDERIPQEGVSHDPFGLKKSATDENIKSRSVSPVVPQNSSISSEKVDETKTDDVNSGSTDVKAENFMTDSLSSDGGLFDAYTLGRSKNQKSDKSDNTAKDAKKTSEVENTFGDVDWRQATMTELGDVDWRSSQSSQKSDPDETPRQSASGAFKSVSSFAETSSNTQNNATSTYSTAPFKSVNQSDPSTMYATTSSSSIEQYHTTARPMETYSSAGTYDSYSTSKGPVESYSTSVRCVGEYKTSSYTTDQDHYDYSRTSDYSHQYETEPVQDSDHQPQRTTQSFPGPIHNMMHTVDFSSLKNILANVGQVTAQGPEMLSPGADYQQPLQSEVVHSDSDDDTQNKPAFCTGLSFLKSKQPKDDFTRAKYTGKAKIQPDVGPPPVNPEPMAWAKRLKDWNREPDVDAPQPPKITRFDIKPLFTGPGFIGQPRVEDEDQDTLNFEKNDTGGVSSVFNVGLTSDRSGVIPGFDVLSSKIIPGFDTPSEQTSPDGRKKISEDGQPFRFSEDIPDRDFKSQWYVEPHIPESKRDRKSKRKDSDSEDSDHKHLKRSKKEKGSRRYSDESDVSPAKKRDKKKSTPMKEETANWQDAILESMEESALKVRSDDLDPVSKVVNALFDVKPQEKKNEKKHGVEAAEKSKEVTSEIEPGEVFDADSDEESNLVIDLDTDHKKDTKTDKVLSEGMCDETRVSTEEVTPDQVEEGEVTAIVIDDEPNQEQKDEVVIAVDDDDDDGDLKIDEDRDVIHNHDEMKDFIEDKRKKIVIHFKNETKIVNPKTGKAYTKNAVGSAIQVLGQPAKPAVKPPQSKPETKQIHPIHGIQTIGGGQKPRHISTTNTPQYRSPSPIMQQSSISSISTRVSAGPGFRSTSPVGGPPLIVPAMPVAEKPVPLHYIHPITRQAIQYGGQVQMNAPSQPPVPMVPSLGPTVAQPPVPMVPSLRPTVAQPPVPIVSGMRPMPPVPVAPINVAGQPLRVFVPVRPHLPPAMPIQIVGQPAQPPYPERPPLDMYTRFSEQNQTSVSQVLSEQRPTPNYTMSKNSAIKVIQTQNIPDPRMRSTTGNIPIQTHTDLGRDRKRIVIDKRTNASSEAKRPRNEESSVSGKGAETSHMAKVLDQHDIETLSKVKDVLKSTLENLEEDDESAKKNEVDTAASSELEDGEISDDDDDDVIIVGDSLVKRYTDTRRIVINDSDPYNVGQRIPSLGAPMQDSPKRIVRHIGSRPFLAPEREKGTLRAAADWSDMIKYEGKAHIERLNTKKYPQSTSRSGNPSELDANFLSKSAISIAKTKQKIMARSQVKTLGEWLKIELEADNIQPLQNIIPYALNTDLSVIPKARRRKIRVKVKNAIEQEGYKKMKPVSLSEEPETPVPEIAPRPVIQPNYSPEVTAEQMKQEVELISRFTNNLKLKGHRQNAPGQFFLTYPDNDVFVALGAIEFEMRSLLQRSRFIGYPNRRVPNELLLQDEMHSFKSEDEDIFLILMTPISLKPYNKLIHLKSELELLQREKLKFQGEPGKLEALEGDIKKLHNQRQVVLRSFTGFLNKKRISRLQDLVDKYTMVHNHFKQNNPPVPDNLIRFVRTTQIDLRQHLILAKQYLAMDEKKNTPK